MLPAKLYKIVIMPAGPDSKLHVTYWHSNEYAELQRIAYGWTGWQTVELVDPATDIAGRVNYDMTVNGSYHGSMIVVDIVPGVFYEMVGDKRVKRLH